MLKLFQLWCYTNFVLQVSSTYSSYYEYPLHYGHDVPVQYYRKCISYPNYIHLNTAAQGVFNYQKYYDDTYYYPSTSYSHQCSFIKRTPNPYKRDLIKKYSSPIDTIQYYVNTKLQYPKMYVNYMPKSEENAKFHNYVPSYGSSNIHYPSSYMFSNEKNTSGMSNSRMYPNTYLLQNYMLNPNYYENLKQSQQHKHSTETPPRININDQIKLKEGKESQEKRKIQFMFPSEIVIKSLGPWAPIGNTGEYRSNGTFSIRYEVSKPIDNRFVLNQKNNEYIDNPVTTDNFSTYQTKKNVLCDNKTKSGANLLSTSKDFTNGFVENYLSGEIDPIKLSDNSNYFKKIKFERSCMLKEGKDKNLQAKKKLKIKHYQEPKYERNLTSTRRKNYNKKIRKPFHRHSCHSPDNANFEERSNFNHGNRRIGKRLKKRRKQKTLGKQNRKRAFISDNSDCIIPTTPTPITTLEEHSITTTKYTKTSTPITTLEEHSIITTKYTTTIEITTELTTKNQYEQTNLPTLPDGGKLSKPDCENINQVRCVCSIRKVLQELDTIISSYDESTGLLESLANYTCNNYKPVKNAYKISADMKPRLISNKPKELLVDEGPGPKAIVEDTMNELMARGIPNEGIDFYVFPSTNIEIPCITTNKIQLSPNTADSTKYTWTHSDQKVITEGRFLEDLNHRGSLQINGVTLEDSDNYTCTVNYTDPDTDLPASISFLHSVLVVSEPLLSLHTLIHYNAKTKCDQEILEMFELYLPQQIEYAICGNDQVTKICNVEIHNPMCHTKSQITDSSPVTKLSKLMYDVPRTQRAVRDIPEAGDLMEMSLNYQVDIADIWQFMPSTDNKTHCSPYCQQKVLLKIIEMLKQSIADALIYPVESSVGIVFEPDISTINVKTVIACSGGLQLSKGFCVPCPKGFYSEEGSTQCTVCPPGTYQNDIGAKICENCPHPFKEGCVAMWTTPIMIIFLIGIGLIILLGSCVLGYICSAGFRRKPSRKLKGQIKYKKMKSKSKKQKASQHKEEHPPTPPTEDFSA